MQKIRVTMLYGIIVAMAAAMFFCSFLQVNADYITGSESSFIHAHGDTCYTEQTLSCKDKHTSHKVTESGTYYCGNCGIMTDQWIEYEMWSCPLQRVHWQDKAHIFCKTCGTEHSRWAHTMPGVHTYTEQCLNCGMEEGETTAILTVSADNGWTNSGVTLLAHINVLKQDLTSGAIECSWEGGKLYATQNGTYSVRATDAAGRSISASIEINCIDKNAPVIKSIDANTDGMSKASVYVNVIAEDNESGLDAQAYSTDGGSTWSASSGFLLEEGKDVQLAVRDRAGNITTRSLKRSAFPYPAEPQHSHSDSTGTSGNASSASSADTSSSGESGSVSSGKRSQSSSASTGGNGMDGTSKKSTDNESTQRKNELANTTDNADGAAADISDKDETAFGLFTTENAVSATQAFMIGNQKNKAVMRRLEEYILMARAVAIPAKGSASEREMKARVPGNAESILADIVKYIRTHLQPLLGTGLLASAGVLLFRLIWLHSVVLYCYNGGEEYRRVGLLHLKRKKQEFELYLPEYLLETRGTPRYRLMFKSKLIKRHAGADLVVRGEDYKLRQPLEECVDFVL